MAPRDDFEELTPAEVLRQVRDRQIVAADRLDSIATFTGWFLGLLLVLEFVGGLVLMFWTSDGRVCLPGRPRACVTTATTHPYIGLGVGLLVSSVAALLMLLLAVFWAKSFAVGQEAAAYQLPN